MPQRNQSRGAEPWAEFLRRFAAIKARSGFQVWFFELYETQNPVTVVRDISQTR